MKDFQSIYYPRRARWYSPLLSRKDRVVRGLSWVRIPDVEVPLIQAVASFVVPGLGFYFRYPGQLAGAALGLAGLLIVVFFVWLGRPLATLAFGLLLSLHSTSIVFLFQAALSRARLRFRLLFTVVTLVLLSCLLYLPIRGFIQTRLFIPLRVRDRVIVMNPTDRPADIKMGDVLTYRMQEYIGPHGTIVVRSGYGAGPVLALPGDVVQFSTQHYTVNGTKHSRISSMPQEGSITVPEKTWFVWPELDIHNRNNIGQAAISSAMLDLALVDQQQLAGKAFKRWFFWQQL